MMMMTMMRGPSQEVRKNEKRCMNEESLRVGLGLEEQSPEMARELGKYGAKRNNAGRKGGGRGSAQLARA